MRVYQKGKDFTKDPNDEIGGNQSFGLRRYSLDLLHFYYASRDKDSSYFCVFPHFGLFLREVVCIDALTVWLFWRL